MRNERRKTTRKQLLVKKYAKEIRKLLKNKRRRVSAKAIANQ